MQLSLSKKLAIIVILMAAAIIIIGYIGYKTSNDSLVTFKTATENKFPILVKLESFQSESMRLRNKSNELTNHWGEDVKTITAEYEAIEKNFDSKFAQHQI